MPTALHSDMEVAKLRFWCPWLPLMCCLAALSLCTPTHAIPQGGPLFLNSHEKHPPCGVSEKKNMSLVAVNSSEKLFLMVLLGPVFLLLEPRKLPGQISVESPSHRSVARPFPCCWLQTCLQESLRSQEPDCPRCCENQPFPLGSQALQREDESVHAR